MLFIFSISLNAQNASDILNKVDSIQKNYQTMKFEAIMKIQSGNRALTKNFYGFLNDKEDKAFMEYTNPQDRGTRYLKLKNDMWIYIADAQDVLKLSGHLLRDGMMGSDISYDDMMKQGSYASQYNAVSVSSTNFEGKDVYLLVLDAKNESDVNYVRQDLYVDKNNYYVQKVVMYAKGRNKERAIKEFILSDYVKVGTLNMPKTLIAKDLRKRNSSTKITYDKMEIDISIDDKIFTRAYLEN